MDWTKYKYLNASQNWGDPDKMQAVLLNKVDAMCQFMQSGVYVSFGTQGIHEDHMNLHGRGLAVDLIPFDLIDGKASILDCFFTASRFGFTGIGLYPDWQYNDKKVGGLHLDIRPAPYMAQWLAIRSSGTQVYIRLTEQNLKMWGAIK